MSDLNKTFSLSGRHKQTGKLINLLLVLLALCLFGQSRKPHPAKLRPHQHPPGQPNCRVDILRLEGANWWRICTCSALPKNRFRR